MYCIGAGCRQSFAVIRRKVAFGVAGKGKYLGFWLGPSGGAEHWKDARGRFAQRCRDMAHGDGGHADAGGCIKVSVSV